jgi:hypothetical protein
MSSSGSMMSQVNTSPSKKILDSMVLKLTHEPLLVSVTSQEESPQQANEKESSTKFDLLFSKLTNTVTTLHKELQEDIKKASEAHKLEITKLEERLQSAQETKYVDLSNKLQTNHEEQDVRLKQLVAENLGLQQTVNENSGKIIAQALLTAQLNEKLEALCLQVESNQQNHDEFETGVNEDLIELRKDTKTAIHLANSVEQHGRRWAIRLLGMKAPEGKESKEQAKEKVVAIIHDIFKIPSVRVTDLDCAHRVGYVTKTNKQTMLVRFHQRDLVDDLMSRKANLKNSGIILYDDMTHMNRLLLNKLNARDDIVSVWTKNGAIWARPIAEGPKFKMQVGDDIEKKLSLQPQPDDDEQDDDESNQATSPIPSPARANTDTTTES